MQIPRMNARFTLEAPQRVPDGGGGWTVDWTALGIIWGALTAVSAREPTVGTRPASRVTHRVVTRKPADRNRRPTADHRLRLEDRIFAIRGVADADPRGAYLELWIEEGPFS